MKKKSIVLLIVLLALGGLITSLMLMNNKKVKNFTTVVVKKVIKQEPEQTEEELISSWYDDFEYELVDSYINLTSIKDNFQETNYTLPSKATIDGVEYTTKLATEGVFASSPITELKLEDGVVVDSTIQIFKDSNITKLDMSNMDLTNILTADFLGAHQFDTLDFSNSNLSNLTTFIVDENVLANATLLDFSNADLSSAIHIYILRSNIDSILFEGAKLTSFKESGSTWFDQSTIRYISFANADLEKLQYMDALLLTRGNTVEKINMSGAKLPNLIGMSGSFNSSASLKSVDLSNITAPKLTSMSSAFANDTNLEEFIMDGFNAVDNNETTYFYMSGMFNNCPLLKKVTIEGVPEFDYFMSPDIEDLTLRNVKLVRSDAGYKCNTYNEKKCVLKKLTLDNVGTVLTKSFSNYHYLEEITILGDAPTIEQYAFYYEPENSEYQGVWVGYDDVSRLSYYTTTTSKYMPLAKITKLTYDDPNILLYDFRTDTRFITDGEEHELTYDYNYEDSPENETVTFTAGDRVKYQAPTRDEYTFRGWNTKPDGSGELYTPNEVLYLNKDITLYANWRRRAHDSNNYTSGWIGDSVRWRYESGTVYVYPADENSDGRTYDEVDEDNSRLTVPEPFCNSGSNIVFEEGITYIGKYLSRSCSRNKITLPSTLERIGEGAFFANYTTVEGLDYDKVYIENSAFGWPSSSTKYNLVIDSNGGKYQDGTTTKEYEHLTGYIEYSYDYNNRTYYSAKINSFQIEIPQKEGYIIESLNTKPDGTGKKIEILDDNNIIIDAPADMTLYAIYQKDKIKITYHTGDIDFEVPEEELYYGERLTELHPEKENYVFAEWNTKEDGTGIGYYPGQMNKAKEDLELYAIFRIPRPITSPKSYSYAGNTYMIEEDDGTQFRIIKSSHDYYSGDNAYYEVSKEYLEQFKEYQGVNFDDYVYNELKTLVATYSGYNDGGFFDTLYTPDRFYDAYYDMPYQLTERIIDPRERTSNNGVGEKCIHALRMAYVFEHSDSVGPKYKLRVFTNGTTIYVGIEPIKAQVTIRAIDEDTEESLEGMVLGVFTTNKELIEVFTVGKEDYTLGIPLGNDYVVKVLKTADGYFKTDPAYFTINITNLEETVVLTDRKDREYPEDPPEFFIANPETRDGILIITLLFILLGFITYKTYKKAKFLN